MVLAVLGGITVLAVGYGVILYNGLVRLKHAIDRDWSNIDVLLKQRFDELPKLVKVCEGYMQHEQRTLEAVVKARALAGRAQDGAGQMQAQNALTEALRSLLMVVERYPELKADQGFRQLSARISALEEQIADRREFFNESVNLYNVRLDQLPDLLIARPLGFTPRSLWQIDPAHRADVDIAFTSP